MPTIYGSTNNEYIDAKIVYSNWIEYYKGEGTSIIQAALYYKRNDTGSETKGTGTFSITVDGYEQSKTKDLTISENDWVEAIRANYRVFHYSDGTSPQVEIYASGYIPGTTLTSTNVTATIKLDDIPLAATIDSLSCDTSWFNGKMTYKYTPKSAIGYIRCNISLNLDGAYTAVKTIDLGQQSTSQKTATVTLTEDELSTIYNELPSSTKGKLRFTFCTYSDSGYSTRVGEANYKEIALSIPDISDTQPTATMTLSPVSSLSSPFDALYIKGMTKVNASFTNGKGKYGAKIVSYKMNVCGRSYGYPYTSEYLTTTGTVTVEGVVTDSRGFARKYTQDITVIPYGEPSILPSSGENKIICARCDKDGNLSESGTYLRIKALRSYSPVASGGVQKNFCNIRYRCAPEDTKFLGDEGWVTLLAGSDTSTDSVDKTLSGVVSSIEAAYVIQIGVIDDLGYSSAVQFMIPTDFVTVDIPEDHKGRRIGVGRYAEDSDEPGLDMGMPIHGGGVDNLTLGKTILATSSAPIDLDNFKIADNYYSPSADNSKYIFNTPYKDGGFGLEVRELQSKNHIKQTLYYGNTTWIRHWNSTEWSGWVRLLVTDKDESFVADFVTEKGTSNGWTYKKWKSGTFEMFGYFTVKATAAGTAYGNMFYSEQFKIPAPFTIISAVVVGTANNWFIPIMGELSNGVDGEDPNKNIGIRLYRPTSFAIGQELSLSLHVTGEYK